MTHSRKEAANTQEEKEKSGRIQEIGVGERLLAFKMTTMADERVTCVDSREGCRAAGLHVEVQTVKTKSGNMLGYTQGSNEIQGMMKNSASRAN